ncbi:choice-of-anchor A family protein, partial [Polaribacter sp.]|uniref:choice-of-anchor A family protein n=1 Tax=Polaribacter sp. TaxID=1920175 RepID=UPI003F6D2A57
MNYTSQTRNLESEYPRKKLKTKLFFCKEFTLSTFKTFLVAVLFTTITCNTFAQSPTAPAQGFNVFVENNATLNTNESEGAVAIGGDLILQGNYRVSIHDCGVYTNNGLKIGLLVDGKIDFGASSNGQLYVNSNYYAKIGDGTGTKVWYTDQNNATSPIRITEGNNYNSSTRVNLQANATTLGNVSANNNPVIEGNLIDFTAAFQTMRTSSTSISQNANNAQITNPNGQSISNTNLPNQIKINLQNGINYLNVTGSDLNNVSSITFNNQPSASKVLVINVDASGTFNWNVWNQAAISQQHAAYILYNFYNTIQLNIQGNPTIEGTVFAPFADIDKTVNQSNIEGQVIGKSIKHSGGEMHCAAFTTTLTTACVTADNTTTTAAITEGDTKTLTGAPAGGTWSIVSGGGTINGTTYTPDNINTNTDVTIRYTIAADGSCAETTDDVTFTVTPICVTADNTTTTAAITEGDTKTLTGAPAGGTWSIVSGGGTINGTTYTPDNINTNTDVTIRYTIAADGSCAETTDDVTFTVTPVNNIPSLCSDFLNQLDGTNGTPSTTSSYVSSSATYPSPLNNVEMSPIHVPASGYRGFDTAYSVVVGGNYTIPASGGSESEGRVAVGGNFINSKTGSLYGISQSGGGSYVIGAPGSYGLAVDGNIVMNGSAKIQIGFNANPASYTAIAGGTINNPANLEVTNQISNTASGVDIAGIISKMSSISASMSSTAVTGSFNDLSGGVRELIGNNNDLEVFNIDGTANQDLDPGYSGTLEFKDGTIKPGATIVINVSGTSVINRLQTLAGRINDPTSSAANSDLDALVYNVIWNFYEATNISNLTDLNGTLIAPLANLDTQGNINGRIYLGGNLIHSGAGSEIHNFPFTGDLSSFCSAIICTTADNTTTTAAINEGDTKTLTGAPAGGTWSIVSGGGTINGTTYTPDNINTNTDVTIRYTIAADGSCAETTDDVTFTVTPICVTADNTTTTAAINEGDTKTLTGAPAGGTWSIV